MATNNPTKGVPVMTDGKPEQYLRDRIRQLHDDGQTAIAQIIERQMEDEIRRALRRLASQVERGQLTSRF